MKKTKPEIMKSENNSMFLKGQNEQNLIIHHTRIHGHVIKSFTS